LIVNRLEKDKSGSECLAAEVAVNATWFEQTMEPSIVFTTFVITVAIGQFLFTACLVKDAIGQFLAVPFVKTVAVGQFLSDFYLLL
jgi:hypothetical protein